MDTKPRFSGIEQWAIANCPHLLSDRQQTILRHNPKATKLGRMTRAVELRFFMDNTLNVTVTVNRRVHLDKREIVC